MLTRSQLLILAAMVTLGGCFGGGLAVGVIAGDFDFAFFSLGLIVAIFLSVFLFHVKRPKKQKRAGEVHVGGELHEEFKTIGDQWEDCGKAMAEILGKK